MGLFATGTSCLALVWVIGRNRVPAPPARMSAFNARSTSVLSTSVLSQLRGCAVAGLVVLGVGLEHRELLGQDAGAFLETRQLPREVDHHQEQERDRGHEERGGAVADTEPDGDLVE